MNEPVVSIRADCTAEIGYGHVMRSLTVARALAVRGHARVRFLMAPGSDAAPVESLGLEVARLAGGETGPDGLSGLASPGDGPLLIDSYAVAERDLEALRRAGYRVTLFDDENRLDFYPCDVVVNSAPGAQRLPYRGLPETRFCLGTDFFPLREEFRLARAGRSEGGRAASSMVVTCGGSDPEDQTSRILETTAPATRQLDVVAVLGPGYRGRAESLAKTLTNVTCRHRVEDMAALFNNVDLAVSAAGGTAMELAYMGVPTVLLALSEDQEKMAAALEAAGAAVYVGPWQDRIEARLRNSVETLVNAGPEARRRMRATGRKLIDGGGAKRVADAVLKSWEIGRNARAAS